jgi:hypothetical protein
VGEAALHDPLLANQPSPDQTLAEDSATIAAGLGIARNHGAGIIHILTCDDLYP